MPSKDALQRLIDGLQTLIREHLALARAELKDDARTMGRDLLVGAAGVPALAAGYLLLMMAIGYLPSRSRPLRLTCDGRPR
ncbi:MAG: phage holin family protein [Myxococcales bacterium]|nr:phage holin family protein [Myxococcales bacterium]